jgi:hypothetical protein
MGERITKSRIYSTWHNMKSRCYNPNTQHYNHYGGRGIIVCDEWKNSFQAFHKWAIENGYRDDLTIDRIDVNGNYEPSNCRWVDMYCQNNNTSKNRYITHNGETKTAAEWARQYGINTRLFSTRMRRGWRFERAINPNNRHRED